MFGPSQGRQWQSRATVAHSKDRALRVSIFAASLAVVIGFGLFGAEYIAARDEREHIKSELLLLQAQTLAKTVDLEVAQAIAVLRGMAASTTLARGNFSQLQTDMQQAGAGSEASICLVDRDGQVLGAAYPSGSPPSPGRLRIHDYLDSITNEPGSAADPAPSSYFGLHRLDVVFPLTDHRVGNERLGALVYSISPHRLLALLTKQDLPLQTTITLIDPNGIVAASTRMPDQAGQPASTELLTTLSSEDHGTRALDHKGDRMLLAWARAQQTKIAVAITSPPPPLLPAMGEMVKPATIYLVVCLFALSACFIVYRRSLVPSGVRLVGNAAEIGRAEATTGAVERKACVAAASLNPASQAISAPAALPTPGLVIAEAPPRTQAASDAVREQSLHAQRLEVMGTLASGVVHDFGNVLQALDGNLRLIRDNPTDIPAVEHSTDVMLDVLGGARSVVRRLLSFAREEALAQADYDVTQTLSGLLEILRPALPRQIEIKLDVHGDLPPVHVDKSRLEANLLNFAMNAQHAMPTGGALTISARLDPAPQPGQGDDRTLQGEFIRIDTADTGSGMSPEVLARATEAFFTTKPAGQGTGLGLSSARSFAEESNGALRISTELGRGTVVSLWLPPGTPVPKPPVVIATDGASENGLPTAPEVAAPPAEPTAAPDKLSILLVDDEPMIRDVLARQLVRRGMTVKVCEHAAEALAALCTPQVFDLLLTDFAMPDMAGDVLVVEARKLRAGLPVIVLTGHPHDAEVLGDRSEDTRIRLLSKPISGRELVDEIDQLLGRLSGT